MRRCRRRSWSRGSHCRLAGARTGAWIHPETRSGITDVDPSAPSVSCARPEPSAPTIQTCGCDRSRLVSAIRRPSGDHCAVTAPVAVGTIWRRPLPSDATTYSAVESAAVTYAVNAISDPSGEKASENRGRSKKSPNSRSTATVPSGFRRMALLPSASRSSRVPQPSSESRLMEGALRHSETRVRSPGGRIRCRRFPRLRRPGAMARRT